MAIARIDQRAEAYGVPHEMVDGNDMLAVYEASSRAVARARAGEGPSLIGVDTMRMRGHAEHDDMRYVPKELLAEWEARDAIARYRAGLLGEQLATARELDDLDRRAHEHARDEADLAEGEPMPDPATVGQGVYAGEQASRRRVTFRRLGMILTYVEALRDALVTEMTRDERVFLLGEDIGTYGGAFKVTEGLIGTLRCVARHRHAHLRSRDRRRSHRRGVHGHAARGRDAVHGFCELRLRHDHQLRREEPISLRPGRPPRRARPVRRPGSVADRFTPSTPRPGSSTRLA